MQKITNFPSNHWWNQYLNYGIFVNHSSWLCCVWYKRCSSLLRISGHVSVSFVCTFIPRFPSGFTARSLLNLRQTDLGFSRLSQAAGLPPVPSHSTSHAAAGGHTYSQPPLPSAPHPNRPNAQSNQGSTGSQPVEFNHAINYVNKIKVSSFGYFEKVVQNEILCSYVRN